MTELWKNLLQVIIPHLLLGLLIKVNYVCPDLIALDSVYILSFSIIMLATDLHNPSVKSKMSTTDWLRNNRGNNCGQDYERELLLQIYERIAKEPFKLMDDLVSKVDTVQPSDRLQDQRWRQKFHLEADEIIIRGRFVRLFPEIKIILVFGNEMAGFILLRSIYVSIRRYLESKRR